MAYLDKFRRITFSSSAFLLFFMFTQLMPTTLWLKSHVEITKIFIMFSVLIFFSTISSLPYSKSRATRFLCDRRLRSFESDNTRYVAFCRFFVAGSVIQVAGMAQFEDALRIGDLNESRNSFQRVCTTPIKKGSIVLRAE